MDPTIEGPYRLEYVDLDNGMTYTKGFPTDRERFDWVMNTKGVRTVKYINPPVEVTPPPPLAANINELVDRLLDINDRNGADPRPPEWVDEVSGWYANNEGLVVREAKRRHVPVGALLVKMLDTAMVQYQEDVVPPYPQEQSVVDHE